MSLKSPKIISGPKTRLRCKLGSSPAHTQNELKQLTLEQTISKKHKRVPSNHPIPEGLIDQELLQINSQVPNQKTKEHKRYPHQHSESNTTHLDQEPPCVQGTNVDPFWCPIPATKDCTFETEQMQITSTNKDDSITTSNKEPEVPATFLASKQEGASKAGNGKVNKQTAFTQQSIPNDTGNLHSIMSLCNPSLHQNLVAETNAEEPPIETTQKNYTTTVKKNLDVSVKDPSPIAIIHHSEECSNQSPSISTPACSVSQNPHRTAAKKEQAGLAKLKWLRTHLNIPQTKNKANDLSSKDTTKAARLSLDITEIESIMNSVEKRKAIFGNISLRCPEATSTPVNKHCPSITANEKKLRETTLILPQTIPTINYPKQRPKTEERSPPKHFSYDFQESFYTPLADQEIQKSSASIHTKKTHNLDPHIENLTADQLNQPRIPTTMIDLQNMLIAVVSQSMIPFLKLQEDSKDAIRDEATLLALIYTKQVYIEKFLATLEKRLDSEAEQSLRWQQRLCEIARGDREEKNSHV